MARLSRGDAAFMAVVMLLAFVLTRGLAAVPTYTDAYYHFNAASRLAQGEGFVDDYLWNYVDAPDSLPAPSHLYWMPLTSIIAALGMRLFNAPGDYAAAQFFFALFTAGSGLAAYWLAWLLKGSLRHARLAALLTLFGGFFARYWGTIDTFAPYALIGSLGLLWIGLGLSAKRRRWRYWILAGVFAGLGHLTRADGLLLLLTAWAALIFPLGAVHGKRKQWLRERWLWLALVTGFYALTMLPWFIRNVQAIRAVMPAGGIQSIWFTEYNDLFSYPPDAAADKLFAAGLEAFIESRWTAAVHNLATFVAVEGMIVLSPLMLVGWWQRRKRPLLRGFCIFVIGIHLAMTLVFPFVGYRGGLFHAVAALVPFWMTLGLLGLDDVIGWVAARRHSWNPATAKPLFSVSVLALAVLLSLMLALSARTPAQEGLPPIYVGIRDLVPPNARLMVNDPAQLYYFLGMGGVTLPNESVDVVPQVAARYEVDYLLLESVGDDGFIGAAPAAFQFDANHPPEFLLPIPFSQQKDVRLYAILRH